jgi:hypothetical protein
MDIQLHEDNESYYSRNERWLQPAIVGLLLVLAPFALAFITEQPLPIPAWLMMAAAAFAFALSGVFAAMCETFSALVVRILAQIVAIMLLLSAIFFG